MTELRLFDNTPEWEQFWVGMPAFSHEDQTPVRSIIVHFESEFDADRFAAAVDQRIGPNTKSIWYPEASELRYADKRYAYVPEETDEAASE